MLTSGDVLLAAPAVAPHLQRSKACTTRSASSSNGCLLFICLFDARGHVYERRPNGRVRTSTEGVDASLVLAVHNNTAAKRSLGAE